jgi:hypothetical protein
MGAAQCRTMPHSTAQHSTAKGGCAAATARCVSTSTRVAAMQCARLPRQTAACTRPAAAQHTPASCTKLAPELHGDRQALAPGQVRAGHLVLAGRRLPAVALGRRQAAADADGRRARVAAGGGAAALGAVLARRGGEHLVVLCCTGPAAAARALCSGRSEAGALGRSCCVCTRSARHMRPPPAPALAATPLNVNCGLELRSSLSCGV